LSLADSGKTPVGIIRIWSAISELLLINKVNFSIFLNVLDLRILSNRQHLRFGQFGGESLEDMLVHVGERGKSVRFLQDGHEALEVYSGAVVIHNNNVLAWNAV